MSPLCAGNGFNRQYIIEYVLHQQGGVEFRLDPDFTSFQRENASTKAGEGITLTGISLSQEARRFEMFRDCRINE